MVYEENLDCRALRVKVVRPEISFSRVKLAKEENSETKVRSVSTV